jgi:hypothetical protein
MTPLMCSTTSDAGNSKSSSMWGRRTRDGVGAREARQLRKGPQTWAIQQRHRAGPRPDRHTQGSFGRHQASQKVTMCNTRTTFAIVRRRSPRFGRQPRQWDAATTSLFLLMFWSRRVDLNRGPADYELSEGGSEGIRRCPDRRNC